MGEADPRADATPSLWRHKDFIKLWTGETVSVLGTQVTLVAMPLVALKLLGASTFQVGLLASLERLPFLLVGLPAGAIVDRVRRRPVLIASDLGRALALGSIPVAYWAHALSMSQLYVVVFVTGVLTVFFDVAYQSYLPALVSRIQLVEGNSKLQVSESGAEIVGPALAGLLYQLFRAGAIVADAISYIWSAACVMLIRGQEVTPISARDESGERVPLRRQIAEGVRYVAGHRYLRAIAACTAIANLFSSMLLAVFFTYAVRKLHMSAGLIGLVFAIGSVGFLLGALAAQPLARRLGVGPTIVWSAFLFGPPMLLIPLAPQGAPVPMLAAAWFVASTASPIYNITQVSLRQAICPHRLQGRMNATMRFMVWGTMPIGALLGGILGSNGALGLRPTLYVGAIGQLISFVPVALSPVRSIRGMPDPEVDPVATPVSAG
jgi:MFS family permease